MAKEEIKRFTFVSGGLPEDTFTVVEFSGTEGISRLYEFDITLASDDPDIDLKKVLQDPATFTILGEDQDIPIHGILARFEQLHEIKGLYSYRALLVPRLWQADLYRENQLFLDQTLPDIIQEIMRQTGLTNQDFELKLTKKYPKWEYICQYRETDFDFISRWMEREGIYYFFEQGEDNEKLIITDSSTAHSDIPNNATICYFPMSGLLPEEETIKSFICRQKRLPNKVILKDYNYRKPSLDLTAEAEVDPNGRGNVYIYGEHFKTPEEGHELAKIRAEEIKCGETIFHGEGTAPNLCPGFLCEVERHYREACNRKYLIVDIEHEGSQPGPFGGGLGEKAHGEEKLTYVNRFAAIPADVQFRPERKTPKTRFYGTMNATIDAEGIGQYAELDDEGRYKVRLPFDQSNTGEGKASRWIRMSQPYTGTDHGMHFPLHKGTEVLLTFVDGDPDRPIISGAVPNPEKPSVIRNRNQSMAVITTGGQNKIHFEDEEGKQRILFKTPTANSWIRVGSHRHRRRRDPSDRRVRDASGGIDLDGDKATKEIEYANGIRIHSAENLWTEARERYADYKVAGPEVRDEVPEGVKYLWDKFYDSPPDFDPTGVQLYSYGQDKDGNDIPNPVEQADLATLKDLAKKGRVKLTKGDTFNTQEGSIYDFRGYWVYNLGNSYVENHIVQKGTEAKLNEPWDQDLSGGGPNNDIKCNDLDVKDKLTAPRYEWIWELEGVDFHNSGAMPTFSKTLDSKSTWVEKTLGGAKYNYTKGTRTLNVEVGTAQETHIHGRASYEYKYSGGKLISKIASKSGHSEEWKYDRVTGVILSHNKTDWLGAGGVLLKSSFAMAHKTYSDISLSGEEFFKFNAGFKVGVNVYAGVTGFYSFNLSPITIKIDTTFNTFLDVKTGAGYGIDLDLRLGGVTKLKPSKEFKFDGVGFTAMKRAPAKAEKAELKLAKAVCNIKNHDFDLNDIKFAMSMGYSIYS